MRSASLAVVVVLVAVCYALPQGGAPPQGPPPQQPPQINWGKCAQLKPTADDQNKKRAVIEECLRQNPPPTSETVSDEEIEKHRETITTCALKAEGWFNANGSYKFDRAKTEIQNKKLPSDVEPVILQKHDDCKKEAEEKFAKEFIPQIQLYQSCMDFHISKVCGIELVPPPSQ